jgi:hypothetical protein
MYCPGGTAKKYVMKRGSRWCNCCAVVAKMWRCLMG